MSGGTIGAIVGPVFFFLAVAAAGYYFFKKRLNKPTPTQQVNITLHHNLSHAIDFYSDIFFANSGDKFLYVLYYVFVVVAVE